MRTLPQRLSKLTLVALSLLASLPLLMAVPAFADDYPGGTTGAAVMGAFFLVMLVIMIAAYVYFEHQVVGFLIRFQATVE